MTLRSAIFVFCTVVLGVSLAIGCAAYEDRALPVAHPEQVTTVVSYVIHGEVNFSPAERATIEWAASEWVRFTDGRAKLKLVWDYNDITYVGLEHQTHLRRLRPEDVASNTIAGWEYDQINIALMPDRCPNLGACALHEFGHLIGLDHVVAPGCVMSAWNPSSTFQQADRDECVRVGICDRARKPDVTTVTVTVDPSIPNVEPDYPRTP